MVFFYHVTFLFSETISIPRYFAFVWLLFWLRKFSTYRDYCAFMCLCMTFCTFYLVVILRKLYSFSSMMYHHTYTCSFAPETQQTKNNKRERITPSNHSLRLPQFNCISSFNLNWIHNTHLIDLFAVVVVVVVAIVSIKLTICWLKEERVETTWVLFSFKNDTDIFITSVGTKIKKVNNSRNMRISSQLWGWNDTGIESIYAVAYGNVMNDSGFGRISSTVVCSYCFFGLMRK